MCSNVVVLRAERDVVDDDAFEAMYRRELHVLTALASSLTGDREQGADLAHEAMARAYRSWATVGQLERPDAWTRRVVLNLATDVHRRGKSEARALERLHTTEATNATDAPATSSDQFWHAVRNLPERQRAAVALHYLDDLGVAEIAEIMEVAQGTVKTSLFMARRSLALSLRAEEVVE